MILILAALLLLATFSTKIAARLGIPGLVLFLALGMIFGSDGLNIVPFDDPLLTQQVSSAFMIIILFEGGFNTKKHLLHLAFRPAFSLATAGVIVTAAALALFSHLVIGIDLYASFLIGAIISSTDAAAIFAILRDKNVQPKSAATLEIESASNDPMAIILTVTVINFVQGVLTNPVSIVASLTWQIVIGILIGYLIGMLGPYLINKIRLDTGGFYYLLVLSLCILSYGLAEELQANGFLAVFFTGFYLGNAEFVYKQGVSRSIEDTSTVCHVMLFLMLGLLVFPSELLTFWKQGVFIALILTFLARPIAVFLCTLFWKYTVKEKLLLCWGGIKGVIPIVLATYPVAAGLEGGHYYFNIVFFVVLLSALVQGSTIEVVAQKLGLLTGNKRLSPHSLELISLEHPGYELLEYDVGAESPLLKRQLQEIPLPEGALVSAIVRENDLLAPRGETVITENDLLYILVRDEDQKELAGVLEPFAVEPAAAEHDRVAFPAAAPGVQGGLGERDEPAAAGAGAG
ncbi:MAG: potassium/proton antiporter, partial [Firmicutes bacterium]|nr:potassium/proton antiporter [Bacillota bacterium]